MGTRYDVLECIELELMLREPKEGASFPGKLSQGDSIVLVVWNKEGQLIA